MQRPAGFPPYDSLAFEAALQRARQALLETLASGRSALLVRETVAARAEVLTLFRLTNDLADLAPGAALGTLDALRNVPAWRISKDLLSVMLKAAALGAPGSSKEALIEQVVSALVLPEQYPWLLQKRAPTAEERDRAVAAVTERLATQRAETAARNEASAPQEARLREFAALAGYKQVHVSTVRDLADIPSSCYSDTPVNIRCVSGNMVSADHVLRFGESGGHRLLLIEAKIANDATNSHKRLFHEIGNKAQQWRATYGGQAEILAFFDGETKWETVRQLQEQNVHFLYGTDEARVAAYVDWLTRMRG